MTEPGIVRSADDNITRQREMRNAMNQKIEPTLEAVEKALTLPQPKSFAPPAQRGIHELISEVREDAAKVEKKLEIIEQRMTEFDRLQANFYNGRKP